MNRPASMTLLHLAGVLAFFLLPTCTLPVVAQPGKAIITRLPQSIPDDAGFDCDSYTQGSPYIPVDSWVYPAAIRLYSLGYITRPPYLNMRPWTRASLSHMLEDTEDLIADSDKSPAEDEAEGIYDALKRELRDEMKMDCPTKEGSATAESTYTAVRGIGGTPLQDSFHLGSTIVNDYGRPYSKGLNSYTGASGYASAGRFVLYARGEFQTAPSNSGYPSTLAARLEAIDGTSYYYTPACWVGEATCNPVPIIRQATIPSAIDTAARGRFLEAYVSAQLLNHVFSFGKQDFWESPAYGGAMSYSNNAENLYSFRINRIEPLNVPLLSHITGPFRYEFMVGPLKGHSYPIDPWVHVEKVSFRPTVNFELGFERTAIWGGKGHVPVNLKSFAKSFFSFSAPEPNVKNSREDPGARFGAFDFSYKLPFVRNWLTLYSDGEVHDDVSPIDAPRRAAWRPGLYLARVPGLAKLDIRAEVAWTDPPVVQSNNGRFMYWEVIQRHGYTNSGQIFGDWVGREGKGGQAWVTYHLSGNEWIQLSVRNHKVAKDFVPGGTTLNDFNVEVVKRIKKDFEIKGNLTIEHWKAPVYLAAQQTVTAATVQLTWFPGRKVTF